LEWDGKDQYGNKIANGTYFYHVKAKSENDGIFENIYKVAKIE
jgi:flagellar hook assembly protein FlgD